MSSTLLSPNASASQPKGHRRVKSLVREFDEVATLPPTSPEPSSPSSPAAFARHAPPSPSPTHSHSRSPSHSNQPHQFRRSVSIPSLSGAAGYTLASVDSSAEPIGASTSEQQNVHRRRGSLQVIVPSSSSTFNNGSGSVAMTMRKSASRNSLMDEGTLPGVREEGETNDEVNSLELQLSTERGQATLSSSGGRISTSLQEESQDFFLSLPTNSRTVLSSPTSSTPLDPPTSAHAHARKHSRIHERNLSAFFPHPGQGKGIGYGDTYEDPYLLPKISIGMGTGGVSEIPYEGAVDDNGRGSNARSSVSSSNAKGRRGHHHRHSLSHNLFPFVDNPQLLGPSSPISPGGSYMDRTDSQQSTTSSFGHTQNGYFANYSMSPDTTAPSLHSPFPVPPLPLPLPSLASYNSYPSLPYSLRFIVLATLYLPLQTQLSLLLSVAQIVLGAILWITGQTGESLAVTGLGYLVVFDGIGGLSGVLVEGGRGRGMELVWELLSGERSAQQDESIRFPFGKRRLITLSHFSQAIYLLFSAVYVCKESVEHVLLLHGGEEDGGHGAGHGMGHGVGGAAAAEAPLGFTFVPGITLPVLLLALSALASLISAIMLENHQTLSNAVGPSQMSFLRPRRSSTSSSSSSAQGDLRRYLDLVGNPFTLIVLLFSVGLIVSSFTIPAIQLAPLDKVVALLQSIAMFYVAYPAAVATGRVLLQTSPPAPSSLSSALRDIENHPLVYSLSPPHIWQLTPSLSLPPSSSLKPPPSPMFRRGPPPPPSSSASGEEAILVTTLLVHVDANVDDRELVEITRFVKERWRAGLGERAGEWVAVEVRRKKGEGGRAGREGGGVGLGLGIGKAEKEGGREELEGHHRH